MLLLLVFKSRIILVKLLSTECDFSNRSLIPLWLPPYFISKLQWLALFSVYYTTLFCLNKHSVIVNTSCVQCIKRSQSQNLVDLKLENWIHCNCMTVICKIKQALRYSAALPLFRNITRIQLCWITDELRSLAQTD